VNSTLRNFSRHEFIGLSVVVAGSTNPSQKGMRGRVIDETKNTIVITDGDRGRRLQKPGLTLRFTLPDSSSIEVTGEEMRGRPVDRVKKNGRRRNERRRH
jgi:ribonuclease P protein subunit POP4